MGEKPPCEVCKKIYAKRGDEPPCEICVPSLMDSNVDVARIFLKVKNQVKTVAGEIVDIDFSSVKMVMDLYEIENQKEVFDRIFNLFHKRLEERKVGKIFNKMVR